MPVFVRLIFILLNTSWVEPKLTACIQVWLLGPTLNSSWESLHLVWPPLALNTWILFELNSWILFERLYCIVFEVIFFQHFPEFFRFRLSLNYFSVQVILYGLYNIQVWTLWRLVLDCQCFISCFCLQIRFHCISSALGIIIMLKNKTIPNQSLSRRNVIMN